jgi:hypothetical protein
MPTLAINYQITANGNALSARISRTSGGGLSIDESIPAPSTDKVIACAIDISQLQGAVMMSDVDMVVHTNTLAGDDDITLEAGEPWIWHDGLLTADITELHIVLAGSTAARFQAEFVFDPTV